MRAAKV